MKRRPIKQELKKIVLLISLAALLLSSVAGLLTMNRIRSISEESLISRMKQNLGNIVADKAESAGLKLSRYANYINLSADFIEGLYEAPDSFQPVSVLPPDAKNAGVYSLQRCCADESVRLKDIKEELELLGCIESIWAPMMAREGEFITTVYLGTESGFLISYDRNAELAEIEADGESYYNYFASSWYCGAKDGADSAFFTEVYPDSYGRGLTVSCATPFYNRGVFAGVVCMDILVSDLQRDAVSIDFGEGSRAFLVDGNGSILAFRDSGAVNMELESINQSSSTLYAVSEKILSGNTGVEQASSGLYCAFAPLGQADWILCAAVPEDIVLSGLDDINRSILDSEHLSAAIFLIILVAVAFLVSKFSAKLTSPLLRLKEDVGIISEGNLDHVAEKAGNDEIGDLAEAFNGMTGALKNYISELTSVTAEKERIGAELSIASHIQSSMLPCIFPPFPDRKEFDIYATMVPAKEVGGDFYDLFMVDETHIAMVMADVSGKGVPAALFMVIGKTLIKDHTVPGEDLGAVFSSVNNMLCESNSEGLFITAFECVLDLVTGELRYVNAGHNPPLIRRAGGSFEYLRTKAAFVLAGMEGIKYRSGVIDFNVGDELFMYTDGITEASNSREELYGEQRLKDCLNSAEYSDCRELLNAVKLDTDAFAANAPQFDDMTMLALKLKQLYAEE